MKRAHIVTTVFAFAVLAFVFPTDAAAQQGAPVRLVEPLPLPTMDADQPARRPFQKILCSPPVPLPFPCSNQFTVPSNRQLVIEYVSGNCRSDLVTTVAGLLISTSVGGANGLHRIPAVHLGTNTMKVYSFGQTVRIYADAGTGVSVGAIGFASPGPEGELSCDTTLSGHYVAVE